MQRMPHLSRAKTFPTADYARRDHSRRQMADLIGRTVLRIGSLARRRAKQPASADWLHNARGRFYFQIAYCLFRVPRVSSRRRNICFPFALTQSINNKRAPFVIDNAAIEFRSRRRCSASSTALQRSNFNRRSAVRRSRYFPSSADYRRCPLTVGLSIIREDDEWRALQKDRKADTKYLTKAEFAVHRAPRRYVSHVYDQSGSKAINDGRVYG